MKITRNYPQEETQKAFDSLPVNDEATLKIAHEAEVYALNNVMNARVQATLDASEEKSTETPKLTQVGIIDHGDYFEVGGFRVSKENLWEPQCSEIEINPKKAFRKRPQAWSKESDGKILWFYNWEWAKKELAHRGERLPTIWELLHMLNSIRGTAEQKAAVLRIPLAGFREASDGRFFGTGRFANLWSSSLDGDYVRYAYLTQSKGKAKVARNTSRHGLSVRSFLDKRD